MINKYWSNRKKIEWLNENFASKSDGRWGRFWFYEPEGEGPLYSCRVAHLPEETQGPDGLEIDYYAIEKYTEKG